MTTVALELIPMAISIEKTVHLSKDRAVKLGQLAEAHHLSEDQIIERALLDEALGREFPATATGPFLFADLALPLVFGVRLSFGPFVFPERTRVGRVGPGAVRPRPLVGRQPPSAR